MKIFVVPFILLIAFFFTPFAQGEGKSFNRARTYDVQHYVMRLSFDVAKKEVFGDSTITLKPLAGNFQTLELDAVDMKFDSVTLETSNTPLQFQIQKNKIVIKLDKTYSSDEEISVRLKYTAFPKKGIYFVKALRERGRTIHSSQIWTQGEAEEAHHWLPSFDFPDDKATTEKYITVQKGETVIGNGELVETVENPDKTTTFHYKMNIPHSLYLTSFVVGKYEKISDQYKNIPLGFYVYPGQKAIVPKAYGKTKDMFRIFEALTGVDFPYNKYDQTMVADFQFGGMENITATTMADSEIMMAQFKFGQGLVEDLVSHELAHSWFGNMVTCRNWAELWLNEGFATYMEAAYREKMYGRADYLRKIQEDASVYFAYDSGLNTAQHGLFNVLADPENDDALFDPITYQKGSAVLHTLREEVGTEVFWKALNSYLLRHKFANVETKDLQNAFEEASGKDLDWFFKQWVYAEGYPTIKVTQNYKVSSKTFDLIFTQTQKVDKDTPEAFRLPLEIQFEIGRSIVKKDVILDKRTQTFSFETDGRPTRVKFDKDLKLPLKIISSTPLRTLK